MQSNNGLVNRAAALAGGGIVLLPTFYLGEQLRSGALKPVLCKFKPQELAVYAVYPRAPQPDAQSSQLRGLSGEHVRAGAAVGTRLDVA
jgi:DNA-binding transcriptional LysR family regulator